MWKGERPELHYTPYSARKSPETTHKLMIFCMEVLILGFCFFKLFPIGCIGLTTCIQCHLGGSGGMHAPQKIIIFCIIGALRSRLHGAIWALNDWVVTFSHTLPGLYVHCSANSCPCRSYESVSSAITIVGTVCTLEDVMDHLDWAVQSSSIVYISIALKPAGKVRSKLDLRPYVRACQW